MRRQSFSIAWDSRYHAKDKDKLWNKLSCQKQNSWSDKFFNMILASSCSNYEQVHERMACRKRVLGTVDQLYLLTNALTLDVGIWVSSSVNVTSLIELS